MKISLKNSVLACLSSLLLLGCEDVATNVKMPPSEKKIVVQCFISSDDETIEAMLSWSKPVLGTSINADPELIKNALVELSDGAKKGILLWNNQSKLYELDSSNFNIEAGKTYFLTASLPDGKKVSAQCEVPASKNSSLILAKRDTAKTDFGDLEITFSFNYKDHETSKSNFYRLHGEAIYPDPWEYYYVSGEFRKDTELFSKNSFKVMYYEFGFDKPEKVMAWLINCDINYFEYHKTLQGAERNMGFFSEPSIVFSNIEGGLGCFGAYNSFEVEVDL